MNLDKQQKTRLAVALGAVVVLVLGFAVLNRSDSDTNVSANNTMRGPGGQNGQGPPGSGPGGPGQMEEVLRRLGGSRYKRIEQLSKKLPQTSTSFSAILEQEQG